jgi:hypothetical protein
MISSDLQPMSVKQLRVDLIHSDELVDVYCSVEAPGYRLTIDHDIFRLISSDRCYRPTFTLEHKWNPHDPSSILQLCHPIAWINVKKEGVTYELMGADNGFITGHNFFIDAVNSQNKNLFEFRATNQHLDYVFDLPELKQITKDINLLSPHFTPAQLPELYFLLLKRLQEKLDNSFDNNMWLLWFTRLSHMAALIILDIPQEPDYHAKLLPIVLAEKLKKDGKALTYQINNLEIQVVEDVETRARTINKLVHEWLEECRYVRIADRVLKEQSDIYIKIVAQHIAEDILKQLSETTREIIKNEVN